MREGNGKIIVLMKEQDIQFAVNCISALHGMDAATSQRIEFYYVSGRYYTYLLRTLLCARSLQYSS